tara:strand:- start:655 stop:912 length:258 start_codon:yes stop_codon:yes gene_type:complete
MSRLAYLETLSRRDKEYQHKIYDDLNFVRTEKAPIKPEELVITPTEIQLPHYIDPLTNQPWDPYRENARRGKKIHLLRMLRSVLP